MVQFDCYTLKHRSKQKSSAFVVYWNVLEASLTNSVDPDQTGWSWISLIWDHNASLFTLANNVIKYVQQTTLADNIFSRSGSLDKQRICLNMHLKSTKKQLN